MFAHFWRIRVTVFSVNIGTLGLGALLGWAIGRFAGNARMGLILGAILALPLALVATIAAVKRQTPDIVRRTRDELGDDAGTGPDPSTDSGA